MGNADCGLAYGLQLIAYGQIPREAKKRPCRSRAVVRKRKRRTEEVYQKQFPNTCVILGDTAVSFAQLCYTPPVNLATNHTGQSTIWHGSRFPREHLYKFGLGTRDLGRLRTPVPCSQSLVEIVKVA